MIAEVRTDFSIAGLWMLLATVIIVVIADVFLIELPAKRGQFVAPSRDHVVMPALAAMAVGDGAFELRRVVFRGNQPMLDYWILGIYAVTIAVITISRLFALRRMCLTGG